MEQQRFQSQFGISTSLLVTESLEQQISSMWLLVEGLEKDCQKQKAAFLQGVTGIQEIGVKNYRNLVGRVRRAVAGYGSTDVLMYLRAIAHLSHN